MKVFLSWSGERSRDMAVALRDWLPLVLHFAEPWLSQRDIQAGERWTLEVGSELEKSDFGIMCLTRDNLNAPWILFEAGAISKALSSSAVCPYLLDAEFREVSGPLSQFQAKKTDEKSTLELVQSINARATEPVEAPRLQELFAALWPKLEHKLSQIPKHQEQREEEARPESEVLEELVEIVRAMDRRLVAFEKSLVQVALRPSPEPAWLTALETASEPVSRSDLVNEFLSKKRAEPPPVHVYIDTDQSRFARDEIITLRPDMPTTFLVDLAKAGDLDIHSFGNTWAIMDAEGERFVRSNELRDLDEYFGASDRVLRLTDISHSS